MTRISGLGVTHNDFHVEKPDDFDPGGSGSGSGAPFGFHDGGRTRDLLGAVYGNGWHGPSGVVGEAHRGTGAGATPLVVQGGNTICGYSSGVPCREGLAVDGSRG
jgi:hypothetical protein